MNRDLLVKAILAKLESTPGGCITSTSHGGLLQKLDLVGQATKGELKDALGSMNFNSRQITVTRPPVEGLNNMEARDITIALRQMSPTKKK